MAFIEDRPVACLGWGSGAWAVVDYNDIHPKK
jgi:hypothetical protein